MKKVLHDTSGYLSEESPRRDLIFLKSVSRNSSYKHMAGSGIFFRKLPGGTHEQWLFEGLFEKLLFDIRAGISCCNVKESRSADYISRSERNTKAGC